MLIYNESIYIDILACYLFSGKQGSKSMFAWGLRAKEKGRRPVGKQVFALKLSPLGTCIVT